MAANTYLLRIPPKADPVLVDDINKLNYFIQEVIRNNNRLNLSYNSESQVKIDSEDTTKNYLDSKIVAGTGITKTKGLTGVMGEKILTLSIGAHADLTDMPDTTGVVTDHDVRYVTKVQTATPTTPTPYEGMRWYDTDALQGGWSINVTIVTDTYLVISTDDLVVCNKTTAFTVTLPTATASGRIIVIKNINTGLITVSKAGDTIDGSASQTVYQWESATIVDNAANSWVII